MAESESLSSTKRARLDIITRGETRYLNVFYIIQSTVYDYTLNNIVDNG